MSTSPARQAREGLGVLLIFDLDGTLYRTETSFLPAILEVFRRCRLPAPSREEILGLVGEPLDRQAAWLERRGVSREAIVQVEEIESRLVRDAGALYPGVAETLADLREAGHTLVVCTNGSLRYATAVLDSTGILDHFREIRARLPGDADKTGMVADLLARIPHRRAVVVGDRIHDMVAARANGCLAVGATYGFARPGELAAADRTITSFRDLLGLLGPGVGREAATPPSRPSGGSARA